MAKDYVRGDDYWIYLNTGTYASKTWVHVKNVADPTFNPEKSDILVPEAGMSDGHLQGYGNPLIGFTMFEDRTNTNAEAILAAAEAGTLKEFAIANGPIATSGTTFRNFEANITSSELSAGRGEPASWSIELRRHANSDNDIVKTKVT